MTYNVVLTSMTLLPICLVENAAAAERPNVVLVMTDDQGYGDIGFHGNPLIRTPRLDQFAGESVRFNHFYVCPVCSPTRACLMTGRYNYRTRAIDTWIGRSMMDTDEVTIAEMLAAAGYRTGIFGKWHLGDNYPLRPMDQGFQESLVHRGGGVSQPADPPGNRYMNPLLMHNGQEVQTEGYCSDVYTDAAIEFISENRDEPFFVYLAFNCPHTPLDVPDEWVEPYRSMNLDDERLKVPGHPLPQAADLETTAKVYAMVTNIDDNVGRLSDHLEQLGLVENTLFVFITDNGPQQVRYNAGMLDRKTNVHEGGVRVPCFVRWPRRLEAGHEVDTMAAHIDLTPTILAACGVAPPADVTLDGVNILPLAEDKVDDDDWPDRTIFFQWHRGDVPERRRAFAVRTPRYKLAQPLGAFKPLPEDELHYELYDMEADPLEEHDISAENPAIVRDLLARYDRWFDDVSSTRGYDPPRIYLGTPHENPVILTRQDWRGPRADWGDEGLGHWEVYVAPPADNPNAKTAGPFDVRLRFKPIDAERTASFTLSGVEQAAKIAAGIEAHTFENVMLPVGDGRLEPVLTTADGLAVGANYVDVMLRE
jgi:arylsulfatase A-like enzyme